MILEIYTLYIYGLRSTHFYIWYTTGCLVLDPPFSYVERCIGYLYSHLYLSRIALAVVLGASIQPLSRCKARTNSSSTCLALGFAS